MKLELVPITILKNFKECCHVTWGRSMFINYLIRCHRKNWKTMGKTVVTTSEHYSCDRSHHFTVTIDSKTNDWVLTENNLSIISFFEIKAVIPRIGFDDGRHIFLIKIVSI